MILLRCGCRSLRTAPGRLHCDALPLTLTYAYAPTGFLPCRAAIGSTYRAVGAPLTVYAVAYATALLFSPLCHLPPASPLRSHAAIPLAVRSARRQLLPRFHSSLPATPTLPTTYAYSLIPLPRRWCGAVGSVNIGRMWWTDGGRWRSFWMGRGTRCGRVPHTHYTPLHIHTYTTPTTPTLHAGSHTHLAAACSPLHTTPHAHTTTPHYTPPATHRLQPHIHHTHRTRLLPLPTLHASALRASRLHHHRAAPLLAARYTARFAAFYAAAFFAATTFAFALGSRLATCCLPYYTHARASFTALSRYIYHILPPSLSLR